MATDERERALDFAWKRAIWARVASDTLTGTMTALGDHAPRSGSRTFVGRDRERGEIGAGCEDGIDGRERLFLITGEPGIGKTWLVEHLAAHATTQGIRVYWGRWWGGGGAPPLWAGGAGEKSNRRGLRRGDASLLAGCRDGPRRSAGPRLRRTPQYDQDPRG